MRSPVPFSQLAYRLGSISFETVIVFSAIVITLVVLLRNVDITVFDGLDDLHCRVRARHERVLHAERTLADHASFDHVRVLKIRQTLGKDLVRDFVYFVLQRTKSERTTFE